MERIAGAAAHRSPVFALLDTLVRAELSRITGPADPELWQRVAGGKPTDPYLACHALVQLATCLLTYRRRRAATRALQDAEQIARHLAATPMLAHITTLARQARIEMDTKAPASPKPDPVGLTPREREVITLLERGLSNAEIARTLYISEKTASVHVSNILRKLGVTSRIQAAAAARGNQATS